MTANDSANSYSAVPCAALKTERSKAGTTISIAGCVTGTHIKQEKKDKTMVMTNRMKRLQEWKKNFKQGKRCEYCGTEFDLTLQHDDIPNKVARSDDVLFMTCRILCATCHFLEDHEKMYACKFKAELKRYDKQCADMKRLYDRIERRGYYVKE